jgi:hypothetical protein
MTGTGTMRRGVSASVGMIVAAMLGGLAGATEPAAGSDVGSFLELRKIDRPRRAEVESAADWTPDVEAIVVKILQRIDAPAGLVASWRAAARPAPAAGEAVTISDDLVAVRGRAVFVAPRKLSADLAERLGRPAYDIVRLVDERGLVVDVLVAAAPRAWPRWQPFDEPAAVLGLPLSTTARPPTAGRPTDAAAWPEQPAGLVVAAAGVAWYPDTLLGRLGMDYGLFDSVADGQKIVRGDTAAFYGLLAAAGRGDG